MPCLDDGPSAGQENRQRAAKLLVYVWEKMGVKPSEWALKAAMETYGDDRDERPVKKLCDVLKSLDPDRRDKIVYNARDKIARDLADWWEDHQEADAEREKQADKARERARLKTSALAKLTPAERKALGY